MRLDEFRKICNNVVPCVYSSIAIALNESGFSNDKISDLFERSQEIWQENCMSGETMAQHCYELTGIDVRYKEDV